MDIIKDKEFIELTASERDELMELCTSEDEFNQLKSMFAGISAMNWSNPTPKAETKERLDHLFAQKHPKAAPVWYNAPLAILAPKGKPFYRQPLVQVAAVGLLIFLAYPFVNADVMESKTNQVASVEKEATTLKEKDSAKPESTVEDANNLESKEAIEANETPVETRSVDVNQNVKATVSAAPRPAPLADVSPSRSLGALSFASTEVAEMEDLEFGSGAAQPGSTHPDGIFMGDRAEVFSVPASREPAVFDLLTSTF